MTYEWIFWLEIAILAAWLICIEVWAIRPMKQQLKEFQTRIDACFKVTEMNAEDLEVLMAKNRETAKSDKEFTRKVPYHIKHNIAKPPYKKYPTLKKAP